MGPKEQWQPLSLSVFCLAIHYQCHPCVNVPSPTSWLLGGWAPDWPCSYHTREGHRFFLLEPQPRSSLPCSLHRAGPDRVRFPGLLDASRGRDHYHGGGRFRDPVLWTWDCASSWESGPPPSPRRCAVADTTKSGLSLTAHGNVQKCKLPRQNRCGSTQYVEAQHSARAPYRQTEEDLAFGPPVDSSLLVYYRIPSIDPGRLLLFTCASNYRPSHEPTQPLVQLEPSCVVVPIASPYLACPCHPRLHDACALVGAAGWCIYCTV